MMPYWYRCIPPVFFLILDVYHMLVTILVEDFKYGGSGGTWGPSRGSEVFFYLIILLHF